MPLGDLHFTEGKQRRKGSTGEGDRRGGKGGKLCVLHSDTLCDSKMDKNKKCEK